MSDTKRTLTEIGADLAATARQRRLEALTELAADLPMVAGWQDEANSAYRTYRQRERQVEEWRSSLSHEEWDLLQNPIRLGDTVYWIDGARLHSVNTHTTPRLEDEIADLEHYQESTDD